MLTPTKAKIPLPEELLKHCRENRKAQTKPERILWRCLRNRQLLGQKFRRQFPIGDYIADFCCYEHRIVVELDGLSHDYTFEYDVARQRRIESRGFRVLRFSNQDVLKNLEGVLTTIVVAFPAVLTEHLWH